MLLLQGFANRGALEYIKYTELIINYLRGSHNHSGNC